VLRTIFGRPFVDLEPYVDCDELTALDDEICAGLTEITPTYTGGSHRWMGIKPPSLAQDEFVDYGEVIADMNREEFARFVALSDDPDAFDLDRQSEYEFGEERDCPLSRRQMLYLEYRHGVYFPWKVFYELIPNDHWAERAERKSFTEEARAVFPRTVEFIERLPFAHIGRCNLLGLKSCDHGTVHRDGEDESSIGHFITMCPRGHKQIFLWDEEEHTSLGITARAYWFDDRNYHGVAAAPGFRYSIRVDGAFHSDFLARLERDLG
jgi:hypothetical protein